MKKGIFIVIDGMDGSGKSTQLELLKNKLDSTSVMFTREPGGIAVAERIRSVLLSKDLDSTMLTDIFLFCAARAAHMEKKVIPALQRGTHVITDRFDSSTFAYQLWAERAREEHEHGERMFQSIRQSFPPTWIPSAYIFFDLPAEIAFERRAEDAGQEKTRFDLKPLEYYKDIRAGYKAFGEKFSISGPCTNGKNIQFIDAHRSREVIHEELFSLVGKILNQ